jgi:serine/threonine-protein kinase SRPK3
VPNYLSPEALFERKSGLPADVWGLGCTIFQIRVGIPLFYSLLGGHSRILKATVQTFGKLPEPWWSAFESRHLWFDERGEPKAGTEATKTPIKQQLASVGYYNNPPPTRVGDPMVEPFGTGLDEVEIELLGDLLEKMMRYRPEDRMKIFEVVAHPWFALE